MWRSSLLLLPALLAFEAAPPVITEVGPGLFVLKGVPGPGTYFELKQHRITHVIDLRGDGEMPEDPNLEAGELRNVGADYMRYALGPSPPAADFAFIRDILAGLPRGSRVLLHCSNGNRAAAAACPWLVLNRGMKVQEALDVCRRAGLFRAETEAAVLGYLKAQGRT
jgi:protein tyrosine phosphatase (PTP) superfamily phosphohydrolase (DUF442 family)